MKTLFLSVFLLLVSAERVLPQNQAADFSLKQKGLVRDLFSAGDYFSCIGETRRFLFYGGEIKNRGDYQFFIYGNYFLGRQYRTVIHHYQEEEQPRGARERLLLSHAYMKLGYHDLGYRVLKDIRYGDAGESGAFELLKRKIEPLLLDNAYEEALGEMAVAKPYIPEEKYTELYNSLVKSRSLGYRSPPAAAVMSMAVPGAGQVYSGNPLGGLITFLGVAGTAAGGWYFLKRGERGTGFSLFFFTGIFYAGGIYGAWNASEKQNIEADRGFVLEMKRKFIPPYAPVTGRDLRELFN